MFNLKKSEEEKKRSECARLINILRSCQKKCPYKDINLILEETIQKLDNEFLSGDD